MFGCHKERCLEQESYMPRSKWLLLGMLLGLLLILGMPFLSQQISRATMRSSATLPVGGTPPLVAHSHVLGAVNAQQTLSLSITLSLHHPAALQHYVQAIYTPGSSFYHRYLRPTEFAAQYGPTAQDVQQVSSYLQAQGFTVTHAVVGEQVLDFRGSVAQAEQAFGIQIKLYRAVDGHVFYANNSAPSVPFALRPLVQAMSGLSSIERRQHPPLRSQATTKGTSTLNGATTRVANTVSCPGAGSLASQYYTPAQFASAYNFSRLYSAGYHGEGQSAALFELDSFTASDISAYQACFAPNSPTRINTSVIDGGVSSPGAGALEVELDMDVLLGMLPKLANLTVYEAPNTDTGYNDEWARILRDDVPVVSTSWGMCEQGLSATNIAAEQQFFMQAATQGQSLLAASGDTGAYDCGSSTLSVDDPASNPYMTGVGGTHLALNTDNTYNSESGWLDSPTAGYGSGGGISQLWSMPSYQKGPGVLNSYSSGSPCRASAGNYCRQVPDVSINADPNTGYVVYCTIVAANCQPSAPFVHVGGTSSAAPMWAAAIVLANQYELAHQGSNLGFLNPTIYALLNASSLYSAAFHDVTRGSNLYYPATTAYDMVTGVGTPDVYGFTLAVAGLPGPAPVPSNTHWYFAEGRVGGGFQEYLTLENPSVSSPAQVTINYLLRGKPSLSQVVTVAASTRMTLDVDRFLRVSRTSHDGQDVSVALVATMPIVAERPMYFNFGGTTPGGSDIVGTTQPGLHFTFANGETLPGYNTFITILNPPGQAQATVVATYYSAGGIIGQTTAVVPSGQRSTIAVNANVPAGKQFLIKVDSNQPVVVERPLYFHISVPGINGIVNGGSSVLGAAPGTSWYFPDGFTGAQGTPTQENLIVANPNANGAGTTATVTITYALSNATTMTVNIAVPANSVVVRPVNSDVGAGTLVSMKVQSTNGIGIVAERQEFFSFPSLVPTPSGVEVVGVAPGSQGLASVYSFAEGHLGSSFSEYITLFNPNNSPIRVSVTYFVMQGTTHFITQQQVSLSAMGVAQVNGNSFLHVPPSGGGSADISLVVQSLPDGNGTVLPVVAERSLYFNYNGGTPGSTSVMGYSGS